MGKAIFYHLTRSPVEGALALLLPRALERGWRAAVRGREAERLAWLDEKLWLTGGDDSFLPHGLAGGAHDAHQPVLLTEGSALPNGASCLFLIDGAEAGAAEAAALERLCILFDGADPAAVEGARGQWRALTGAGLEAEYWSEASGRWARER